MSKEINDKVKKATKWSFITELSAKLIQPVINMILARILAPEAFGVVATVTMITSFADMFSDAGFQKYLIQKDFSSEKEKYQFANVAFITNFTMSIILWFVICFFSKPLARLIGAPNFNHVIIIACLQLPLTAFSSIQIALFRRDFDFKSLFISKILAVVTPIFVTLPLAVLGFGYWALIIGNLFVQLVTAICLTIKSKWKPSFYYNFYQLKAMISFSIWTLLESFAIWLTNWIDIFIIGTVLSSYYLGIYKTSITMVNAIMTLITAATTPVLFSALSRFQHDEKEFNHFFFTFQKNVALLLIPLGIGLFMYRDLATDIMLGSRWKEASLVVGLWALTSSIVIIFNHYSSEVYRAKGRPRLSLISQLIHLSVLIPTLIISSTYSFEIFVIARNIARLTGLVTSAIFMKYVIKMPISQSVINCCPYFFATAGMYFFGSYIKTLYSGNAYQLITIVLCILIYFAILYCIPKERNNIKQFISKIK